MDFVLTADQTAFVRSTRRFIESRLTLPAGRGSVGVLDDVRWTQLAELGWLGLASSEEVGGHGATMLDEAFVFREIGRALAPGPILTTLVAGRLAEWTSMPDLATELVAGNKRVSRALEAHSDSGRFPLLLTDPENSVLTLRVTATWAALFHTPASVEFADGIEDGTPIGWVTTEALGTPLVSTTDLTVIDRLRATSSVLTSAQLAGIAVATQELATAYARDRVQFGRPIGAFQSIKHRCADMAVFAFAAENVMFAAAISSHQYGALAAATFCRRAAFHNARSNIQIHGATGFTAENTAHRFLTRTHTLCQTEDFSHAASALAALPSEER